MPLEPADFDTLDGILDEMRARYDETPQWEFCEGFMAALACMRRPVGEAEWLDALLGIGSEADLQDGDAGSFADDAQREQFLSLWSRRWSEVRNALDAPVESLESDDCYHPEVMDVRGAVADMPPEERGQFSGEDLPAFAQVWALGFMFAVECWPEEWAPPRDREAAEWLDGALDAIVAMTEDDSGKPEVSPLSEDGAPSTSIARLNTFGDAIWAVYDLRELWKSLGPRVESVRREAAPGRNDPLPLRQRKKIQEVPWGWLISTCTPAWMCY